MSKTVALYARYSSDLQHESSIESQFLILRERAEREGWKVVEAYSDAAISGATMARDGLKAMLADARAGRFTILLAESLDRIAGDMEYAANIYKRLSVAGVRIYTLSEAEIGDLQIGFAGTFAAMRLKGISEKTRRGQKGKATAGKIAGGNSYGYRVVKMIGPDGELVRGEREIVPEEAAIINRVCEEFAYQLKSPERICWQLNKEGVPGPRGRRWRPEAIRGCGKRGTGLLRNPLYGGTLVWGRLKFSKNPDTMGETRISRIADQEDWVRTPRPDLRIVEPELWDAVQARLDELSRTHAPYRKAPPKLLSFLLRCGECGGGMAMISRTKYGCSNARKSRTCTNRLIIDREHLEGMVVRALQVRLMPPALVEQFSKIYIERTNKLRKGRDAAAKDMRAELARIEGQVANLVQAIKNGVDAALIRDEINGAQSRKAELITALKTQPANEPLIHGCMAQYYRENIQQLGQLLNDPAKREMAGQILRKLIDKIVLTPDESRTKLVVDLYGDLAGILQIASRQNMVGSFQMIAGLNHYQTHELEQVKAVVGLPYDHEQLADTGLQAAVVAGARSYLSYCLKERPGQGPGCESATDEILHCKLCRQAPRTHPSSRRKPGPQAKAGKEPH